MLPVELCGTNRWDSVDKNTFTETQWKFIFDNWPLAERESYKDFDTFYKADSWHLRLFARKTRMTYHEAQLFIDEGITLHIEGIPSTMLTKLKSSYNYDKNDITPNDIACARVVQLALPDIGLLVIDEVTWLDDACTEELQRQLDDGWRILAVCPPNAQRRPDYILGRTRRKANG